MPAVPDHSGALGALSASELREAWGVLSRDERHRAFDALPRTEREDFFLSLSAREQAQLILEFPSHRRRVWMRLLAPDDAADLIQETPSEERETLVAVLDDFARKEVRALLAYAEDAAGGLMSPRFARARADMTPEEAITYLRKQAREHLETVQYIYVTDDQQRLLGVLSLRQLFEAPPGRLVRDVMATDVVTVGED
ncbi:MAG: CBS domain-containing protein, partial [Vicinamibacterales bacterium]